MRKQQQAQLRRLEEAQMAEDYREEAVPGPDEPRQEYADHDCEIYNTDNTDVDLDAYSDDVHGGKRRNCTGILVALAIMLLVADIAFLLKYLEVV